MVKDEDDTTSNKQHISRGRRRFAVRQHDSYLSERNVHLPTDSNGNDDNDDEAEAETEYFGWTLEVHYCCNIIMTTMPLSPIRFIDMYWERRESEYFKAIFNLDIMGVDIQESHQQCSIIKQPA